MVRFSFQPSCWTEINFKIFMSLLSSHSFRRMVKGKKYKDGLGVLVWQDGSKYQGQFRQDKMEGSGRMTQANGSIY